MRIWQIALHDLGQRKVRSILVMLGLAIGIASISSIFSLLESMKTDMASQMTEYGPNIIITADTGEITLSYGGIKLPGVSVGMAPLTSQNAADIETVGSGAMIQAILPKLLGQATSAGQEVIISGSDIQREFATKPWLRIVDYLAKIQQMTQKSTGADAMGGEKLNLERADHTQISLKPSEVLLGAVVAYDLAVFPSNRILINDREFIVKGILEKNGTAEDSQILMNLAEAQQLLGFPDQITAIELAADFSRGSETELLGQIRQILPDAKVTSLRKAMLDRDEVMSRLSYFGFSVSALILFAGMLAASFGMTLAVTERTREIGIFGAIGLRRSFIRKLILLEGSLLSLAGGVLGYITGTAIARAAIPVLSESAIPVPWRLDILAASLALALFVGAAASIYPAGRAAKLDPAEALRSI